jgi:hypothetical protein
MSQYLCIIQRKYEPENTTIYIESSSNLLHRLKVYVIDSFDNKYDNSTHNIWSYKILKSDYTCFQLDRMIYNMSSKESIPFVKVNDTGGSKHYFYSNIQNLSNFLDKLNVQYEMKKEDVCEIIEQLKNIKSVDAYETCCYDCINYEKTK